MAEFLFLLSLLLSLSTASASQARNVQVFFPSNSAPAFPNSPPGTPPGAPPATVTSPPPVTIAPPPGRTSKVTVTRAVVATAASTFVISGLLFFAAFRYVFKRKKIESYGVDPKFRPPASVNPYSAAASPGAAAAALAARRRNSPVGTLKPVIADENGFDVEYFRDEGKTKKRCNHCKQVVGGAPVAGGGEVRRNSAAPLLQEDSLNSSDRMREMISVVSVGSSESITLTPNANFENLPLPPGRRHSSSSSSSSISLAPPPPSSPPAPTSAPTPPRGPAPPPPPPPRGPAATPPPPPPRGPAATPPPPPPRGPAATPPPPPPRGPAATPPPPPPRGPAATPPPPPPRGPAATPPPPPPRGPAATPPPPPPRGPAAPPPPPPQRGPGAPPPPPPGNRPGPPPPPGSRPGPPPPPGVSRPPAPPSRAAAESHEPRLKPLHWDKMTTVNTEHSMVWDKIHGGSFRFDDDLMVALFGNVAVAQKPPPGNPNQSSAASQNPNQVCLLDPRKSQNTAIVLRSLAVSRAEILDSLLDGRGLSADILEKLSKLGLTKEEEETILGFSGNPSSLADAESFLFHLLKQIPSAFSRIDAMLFKENLNPEILHLRDSLKTLETACAEMRKQGLFMRMLEAVLKAGNRMNAGTARGNAQAFNLSSLRKLSDVKSTDGKTTLLHFVVESVVRSEGKRCVVNRNQSFGRSMSRSASGLSAAQREEKSMEYLTLGLPVVGGLSVEYANVKKAAGIEPETLRSTCATLLARAEKMKGVVGSGKEGFEKEMGEFLEKAVAELETLMEEQKKVMEKVKQTTEYYMGSAQDKAAHPLQLFVIVKDFVGMVDQACVDIARGLQQKKKKAPAAAAAEEEKKAPTRFANLPPRFLKENSRSSTDSASDSDDEF